jgi:hypothetical protein
MLYSAGRTCTRVRSSRLETATAYAEETVLGPEPPVIIGISVTCVLVTGNELVKTCEFEVNVEYE